MLSNANGVFAAALVAALADLGLTDVCISPGSRSTPISLAFDVRSDVTSWIHHDERSAGFFALGLARVSGRPVALVCTSGTAATEYLPAVTEAAQSYVPLIVLTADRPPELRGLGAPQTIDQIELYGTRVKWFHQAATPDTDPNAAADLVAAAWQRAIGGRPGPVHVNLPFREPLLATAPAAPPGGTALPVQAAPTRPADANLAELRSLVRRSRVLFVVGPGTTRSAEAIAAAAARCNAVIVADPQSGLRFGPRSRDVIVAADLLVAAGALDRLAPDVVVRFGPLPTSKATWRWLALHPEIPQILVDPAGDRDPLAAGRLIVPGDVAIAAGAIPPVDGDASWTAAWRSLDATAAETVAKTLVTEPFPNEPAIARTVVANVPPGGALFAGSSMPIRDVDTFGKLRAEPLRVVANRGANGIDGSISTAAGIAATGIPTVALIGDVAALHDVGALATAVRMALPLTVVVVHNDGGGIFHLLPQADPTLVDPTTFERVFGTPHGTDFVEVARAFGLESHRTDDADLLGELVATTGPGPRLVEVATDRGRIAPLRGEIGAAVRAILAEDQPMSPSAD